MTTFTIFEDDFIVVFIFVLVLHLEECHVLHNLSCVTVDILMERKSHKESWFNVVVAVMVVDVSVPN